MTGLRHASNEEDYPVATLYSRLKSIEEMKSRQVKEATVPVISKPEVIAAVFPSNVIPIPDQDGFRPSQVGLHDG